MADQQKIEVAKVTTETGRTFYTRETDRAKLWQLPGVKRVEDTWVTEQEFDAIPATEDAREFFGGDGPIASRAGA